MSLMEGPSCMVHHLTDGMVISTYDMASISNGGESRKSLFYKDDSNSCSDVCFVEHAGVDMRQFVCDRIHYRSKISSIQL